MEREKKKSVPCQQNSAFVELIKQYTRDFPHSKPVEFGKDYFNQLGTNQNLRAEIGPGMALQGEGIRREKKEEFYLRRAYVVSQVSVILIQV
jgi:hypothetical protein